MVAKTGQSGLKLELKIATAAEMEAFGGNLAGLCPAGSRLFFQGNLGAGKTTLVRGFLRGLGYRGTVKSPTYTLVEPYIIQGCTIYHFDLYRINNTRELEGIGMRDYFDESAFCLVEWPEHGGPFLGEPDIHILLNLADSGRELKLTARSPDGVAVLQGLHKK